jgi:hypothetical protein
MEVSFNVMGEDIVFLVVKETPASVYFLSMKYGKK